MHFLESLQEHMANLAVSPDLYREPKRVGVLVTYGRTCSLRG